MQSSYNSASEPRFAVWARATLAPTIRNPAFVQNSERLNETGKDDARSTVPIGGGPCAPLANGEARWPSAERDYRKEYARRIARGAQKGLSRSAARGHPRAGERAKPATRRAIDPDSREELALKMMRRGRSLRDAASHYQLSQERLRAYVKEQTEARREGRKWTIIDRRTRQFPFYSDGRVVTPSMSLDETSKAGRYMQAVKRFLRTATADFLAPFAGKGVRDLNGKFHPFELDENTLYELDHRDEAVIPELYRISERTAS